MKITIVGGGGGVGSSAAYNLLLVDEPYEVVVVDSREEMVASHVMDLEQVLELGATGDVRAGTAQDVTDADVVVVSAATPLTVNASRHVYLLDNAAIMSEIAALLPDSSEIVVIVVTNPVDPLCTWLQRITGLDRRRVLGYTLNDSLRFRSGIARALGAMAGSADGWVLGEHGDALVPLAGSARMRGAQVELTLEQGSAAEEFVRTWYTRHVALDSGRSSTWTTGLGLARMVRAITRDTGDVWPASLVLDGEYGIEGVALSVPVSLTRAGAGHVHEWPLTPAEQDALERSAELVRAATERIASAFG